mgnify:CR=1 FL=1
MDLLATYGAAVLSGACVPFSTIGWDRNAQQLAYLPGRGREPQRNSLGVPAAADLPEYASFSEHRIAAGESTMLAFYGMSFEGNRTVTCAIATRFTPVDGANYEVRYGEQSGGICTITASRPSRVRCTSHSSASARWTQPRRAAASVFSGARLPPPRCATILG